MDSSRLFSSAQQDDMPSDAENVPPQSPRTCAPQPSPSPFLSRRTQKQPVGFGSSTPARGVTFASVRA